MLWLVNSTSSERIEVNFFAAIVLLVLQGINVVITTLIRNYLLETIYKVLIYKKLRL